MYYISIPVSYRKSKYSKVLNGDVHEMSMGPSCRKNWGRIDWHSRDVPWTSVRHGFQLTNKLNLLWQVTQDFIANVSGEKFSKQYSGEKHNLNRNMTCCV